MINRAIAGKPDGMVDFDASLPRQLPLHLGRHRRLRAGGRGAVQPDQFGCVFHGIRHRPRRRVRAAALRPARRQDRRARDDDQQDRRTGKQGRVEAPHRRGGEIPAAGTARAVARSAASPPPRKATP